MVYRKVKEDFYFLVSGTWVPEYLIDVLYSYNQEKNYEY